MSDCSHECKHSNSSVYQTLDELNFERGIWYAAQHDDQPRVEELLKRGVGVDDRDNAGYTALHYAARNNNKKICKILLDHGANVNAKTRAGEATALHRAVSAGHYDMINILLNSKADILAQDADGRTVLHRAIERGSLEIIKLLLKRQSKLATIADKKNQLPANLTKDKQILELFT